MRRRRVLLGLELPPGLQGLPWEALIAEAAGPDARRLQPYRARTRARAPAAPRRSREAGAIVVAGRQWRRLVTESWAGWRGFVHIEDAPQKVTRPAAVLHAIGRPVGGTRGQLLQVGGDDSGSSSVEASVRSSGVVLEPLDLRSADGAIAILQAEPFDVGTRLNTDREDAGKLKLFGSEVFAAGAEAVLVIPALPPDLAEELLRRIVARLRRPAWPRAAYRAVRRRLRGDDDAPLARLLALTAELRDRVAQHGDPAVYGELAADICLFAFDDGRPFEPVTLAP